MNAPAVRWCGRVVEQASDASIDRHQRVIFIWSLLGDPGRKLTLLSLYSHQLVSVWRLCVWIYSLLTTSCHLWHLGNTKIIDCWFVTRNQLGMISYKLIFFGLDFQALVAACGVVRGHDLRRRPAAEADVSSGVGSSAADRADSGYIWYVTFPQRPHMRVSESEAEESGPDRLVGRPGSFQPWPRKSHPEGGGGVRRLCGREYSESIQGCSINMMNGLITASKHSSENTGRKEEEGGSWSVYYLAS